MGTWINIICVIVVSAAVAQGQGTSATATLDRTLFPEPTATVLFDKTSRVQSSSVTAIDVSPTPLFTASRSSIILNADLSVDFVGDGVCQCDMLVNRCDVLCCCDRDCSASNTIIFNCSNSSLSGREVCIDSGDIVLTALTRCSCPGSSALCVVSEQDPSILQYGSAIAVESTMQFSSLELTYSLRADGIARRFELPTYGSVYMVGDPVLVLNSRSYVEPLTLPAPLNGIQCHDGNPITYLINRNYECERNLFQLSSVCSSLSASRYYEDLIILEVPDVLARDDSNATLMISISNILCQINSSLALPCQLLDSEYNSSTQSCSNAVTQVSYTIIHDGAGRLVNASVVITLDNIVESRFIQHFSVMFIEMKDIDTVLLRRSGNPGYKKGERVLAGHLTDMGNISISIDSSMWLYTKDSAVNCHSERSRLPIRFQQDMHTSCLFLVSSMDWITDCAGVRQRAFSVLVSDNSIDHVGRFGDSDPSNISHWVQILNETLEEESQDTVCTNVPTSLDISILYSYTGDFSSPQAVVSGVRFIYTTQNIPNKVIRNSQLLMQTVVKFIDITPEPSRVLLSIEGTTMRLPHDFLYPFFASHAYLISLNILIQFICILYIIVFILH